MAVALQLLGSISKYSPRSLRQNPGLQQGAAILVTSLSNPGTTTSHSLSSSSSSMPAALQWAEVWHTPALQLCLPEQAR